MAASQTTPRCTMSAVGCQASSRQSIEGRHVRLGIVEVHEAKASSSHLAGSGMGLARVLTQSMYLERMVSSERPRRLWSRGALPLPRAGAFIARSGLKSRSRRTELASHEYAFILCPHKLCRPGAVLGPLDRRDYAHATLHPTPQPGGYLHQRRYKHPSIEQENQRDVSLTRASAVLRYCTSTGRRLR